MDEFENRRGRSRKSFILGAIALGLAAGLTWAALYGLPALKEKWARENEQQALETLRTINAALKTFNEKYNGYPDTLERLRGGEEGSPETAPPERARLLDSTIANSRFTADGYRFRYRRGAPVDRWAATMQLFGGYGLTAEPEEPGRTGNVFYFTDQTGVIHQSRGRTAGTDDPVVP